MGCDPVCTKPGFSQLSSGRIRHLSSYVSQPRMSRLVAAMNGRNSSTVTALVEMANGRPINTQCGGLSNVAESPSAWFDPCLNRPAGTTVRAGHAGQSRMTDPGFGAAADTTADTFS